MPEITDSGKIWIKGQSHTSFAVKVDDTVFVTGKEEGPALEAHWIEKSHLCVDLHDPKQGSRIARRFLLNQKPTHPAALFSGFNKTGEKGRSATAGTITFQGFTGSFHHIGMGTKLKIVIIAKIQAAGILNFKNPQQMILAALLEFLLKTVMKGVSQGILYLK